MQFDCGKLSCKLQTYETDGKYCDIFIVQQGLPISRREREEREENQLSMDLQLVVGGKLDVGESGTV